MTQAQDFLDESEAIYALVKGFDAARLDAETGFKRWTINAILRHLHVWNMAAYWSLADPEKFRAYTVEAMAALRQGGGLRRFEARYLDGLKGRELILAWRDFYRVMARAFGAADPSARVEWVGPGMSVRSSITARQMESWAHAQAIYDEMGIERNNTDRLRNVVVMGVNTYGWTFKVNGETTPGPMPHLRLVAPSGAVWEYGDASEAERIEGTAEAFAQVVTQCRNIADTDLQVTGRGATRWMAIAQCFAGGAETPPAPGQRKIRAAA